MSEIKDEIEYLKPTIINNYYYIPTDKLKEFCSAFPSFSSFYKLNPINNNKKELTIKHEENFEIKSNKNNNLSKINNNGKNIEQINIEINDTNNKKDLTIEINNVKKPKFLINKNSLKFKKKKGRKPKHLIINSYHTKFSHDNILRKIKVKFFRKITNYINSIIISKYRNKINVLKPLKGKISQNNSINFNQILIKSKLKDIFLTYEINGKYKSLQKSYNKEIINKIYKENIKELIDILEMTFLEVFIIFRDLNETEKLKGFEKRDSVIREIEIKDDNKDYIDKLNNVIMNFEHFYLNKIARK